MGARRPGPPRPAPRCGRASCRARPAGPEPEGAGAVEGPPTTRSPHAAATGRLSPVSMPRPPTSCPRRPRRRPGCARPVGPPAGHHGPRARRGPPTRAVPHDVRHGWCEPHQLSDRVRGSLPRPALEQPAQQDERDDDRRCVEVEHRCARATHRHACRAGGQDHRQAVAVGGPGADRDEGVHGRRAMPRAARTAPRVNGQPAYSWTGVASTSWSHGSVSQAGRKGATVIEARPSSKGMVSTAATTKRRRVSASRRSSAGVASTSAAESRPVSAIGVGPRVVAGGVPAACAAARSSRGS